MNHYWTAAPLRKRPFGHDLVALLRASEEQGLIVTAQEHGWIESFNQTYSTKRWEYVETHGMAYPHPTLLRQVLARILEAVALSVKGSSTKANGQIADGLSIQADWSHA